LIDTLHVFIFANEVFDLSLEKSLTSQDTIGDIDEILEKTESHVCKELEISLIVSIVFFLLLLLLLPLKQWFLLLTGSRPVFTFLV
jgi:hypothetical protein